MVFKMKMNLWCILSCNCIVFASMFVLFNLQYMILQTILNLIGSLVINVPWVSLVLTPENKLLWQWPLLFFFKCCAIAKDEASALCFKGYFSCYRWLVHFFPHLGHLGAIYFSQPHGSASVTWHFYNFTWLLLRLSVFFYFVFVVCNSAFVNFHLRF